MVSGEVKAHLLIKGKVQGVFYRYWTKTQADKLNLNGWVKNLDDGRVEAVFEGEKEIVLGMIKKCKKGPFLSRVDAVKVIWSKATGEFKNFSIVS